MKTFTFLAAMLILITGTHFCYAGDDDLVKLLSSELGITDDQAKGGAGALFNYSKESLSTEDFDKVAEAVPDMDGYLNAIPSLGGKSSGMLGKATEALIGMPAVTSAFEKLGLSQDMVGLFTPILVKYVDDKGGEAVSGLLKNVFFK